MHRYEKVLLQFFRARLKNTGSLKEDLIILENELNELKKDPYEREVVERYNIMPWLRKKIEG